MPVYVIRVDRADRREIDPVSIRANSRHEARAFAMTTYPGSAIAGRSQRKSRFRRIDELRVGDMVDLEGDRFADPTRDKPCLEFEYQTICEINRETPTCIAVGFEGFDIVGFPPDHTVTVAV